MHKMLYTLSMVSAFCGSCYEIVAKEEATDHRKFVQEFTSKICKILFDKSKSQNEKIEQLNAIFKEYLDCDYIKNKITKTYDRRNPTKQYDKSKLGDAAFRFLLSRYVKITSDYSNANVRNITTGEQNNSETIVYFDIDAGRGKVFKGQVLLAKRKESFKIKAATVNNIDLGDAGSIVNKIKQEYQNNPNEFIKYVNKEYSSK